MKRWNELARSSIEQAGCIIVLLVFVIISVASGNRERNTNAAISGDINEGWIDEDGQAVDLYDLEPGDHSVTLDIRGLDTEGKAICFKTVDTNFRVYASDELIYEYNPAIPRHLGLSYGMQYHTIAIPEGSSTLRMDLDPVFANTSAGIRDIAISVAEQYMTYVFKRNLFPFGQCTTTIVIGLLFVIAGITGQIVMKSSGIDFISLGMICVMVGFVGINDTLILQILTGRPELIRVIEYMCFVFLPFPALSFFILDPGLCAGVILYHHEKQRRRIHRKDRTV